MTTRPLVVLGIDPGLRLLPWAAWSPTTHRIVACGASKLEATSNPRHLAQVAEEHAAHLTHAVQHLQVSVVCVEQQGLNTGRDSTLGKAIATGNDLLELQAIGAYVAGLLAGIHGARFRYLPIGAWKGSAPKEVTQNRVLKLCRDTDSQRILDAGLCEVIPSQRHNVYDACGIAACGAGVYVVRA